MVDIGIIITGGVGIVASVISAWTSWFFTRRKYNSEVDLNLVDKMEKSLKFYETLSDDNRKRLEDLATSNIKLEEEVQDLRKQVLTLTMNICMDLACIHRMKEVPKKKRNETVAREKVEKA
nr:MAG TPA: Mid2 like cell wall stress sensor [Crassvirales sp.]